MTDPIKIIAVDHDEIYCPAYDIRIKRAKRGLMHIMARELLARGIPENTQIALHGHDAAPRLQPKSIGELAKWSLIDDDTHGLRLIRYQPMPENLKGRTYD